MTLGASTAGEIDGWIEAKELYCTQAPSPRRMTHQYRCPQATLEPALVRRTPGSTETLLLLVRTDEGPLHHVSTLRRHRTPAMAIEDYQDATAAIQARLGLAQRPGKAVPTEADLDGRLARFSTAWLFTDLEVQLSLSRMTGEGIVVRERWDVPGVEAGVPPRPGSVGHVGSDHIKPHSPHGIVPER